MLPRRVGTADTAEAEGACPALLVLPRRVGAADTAEAEGACPAALLVLPRRVRAADTTFSTNLSMFLASMGKHTQSVRRQNERARMRTFQ